MVNENKRTVYAAVAGMVVGAGAAIAGAVALADKKNQKKVSEAKAVVEKAIDLGKEKAKKLSKVVKTAEKGVKNL